MKHDEMLKQRVIHDIVLAHLSIGECQQKYMIPSEQTIVRWVIEQNAAVKKGQSETDQRNKGFSVPKRGSKRYPKETKRDVVDSIVSGQMSLEECMLKYDIHRRLTVIKWLRDYLSKREINI